MGYPSISFHGKLPVKTAIFCINTQTGASRQNRTSSHSTFAFLKHRNLRPHNGSHARKGRKKESTSIVITSSHLDGFGNFAASVLPELQSRFATPVLQPVVANGHRSILSLPSFVTQIAHQQASLINQIAEAIQTFTNQFIHTLAEQIVEPFQIAYISSPTLSVASIFVTLATSAIAVKSFDKDNCQLSLLNLRSLKERMQQLQRTISSVQPHTDTADAEKALPLQYNPEAISTYYKKRPLLVLSRAGFILLECSILLVNILIDNALGNTKQNESLRASQLVNSITRLGPMAIKVGQALSIRPDLLPPVYLDELEKLQDCVPPFSSEEAKRIVSESLGATIEDIYSEFSANPIAAASVGQVYKAKLKETGETVAVKVQRPDVFGTACLDLFIIRALAKGWQKLPNNNSSDTLNFIDHWASHFFQELDYTQEARNTEEFSKNMQSLASVVVPKAIKKHTSRKVLTITWITGEKLSESKEADVPQLTSVALNCYLMQLLESGFLHADPHPGNLLRTKDGRLCVLDFGLMIQVTEEQRYALIDYISHLVNSDYERVPDDLIKLGFVPHPVDNEMATKILPELSHVLSQLVKGGGLKEMDVEQIIADLARMASEYSIVIPPYFAMVLRAFSILEGIGLKNNPNYVIMDECYPYICKRLLTDNSPRAQTALKYFLYGKEARLNTRRVEAMLKGFQSFRNTMLPTPASHRGAQLLDPTTKQILDTVFAPEGSFLQELLLAEIVRIIDALSREAVFELWNTIVAIALPLSRFTPPPFVIPISGFFGLGHLYSLSNEDREALTLVRTLAGLLSSEFTKRTAVDMTAMTHGLTALLPELAGGALTASTRFWIMLLHRKALRFADDLDGKNSVAYWNVDPAASARHVRPFGFLAPPRDASNVLRGS